MKIRDKYGQPLSRDAITEKVLVRVDTIALEISNYILQLVGWIPSHYVRRFVYRLAGMKIGAGSTFHMGASFYEPSNIVIGQDTIIGEGAVFDGRDKLIVGDHVAMASQVMIYNFQHNIHSELFEHTGGSVVIEDYVFIGPRATILPNVTIKRGGIVAAGAVVTKDVEENQIVAGVPAKPIGTRRAEKLAYKLGRPHLFR